MQPTTTKDLTDEMVQFSERYLDSIGNVDGFILKSQSPSCGLKDAEIFTDPVMDTTNGKDNGIFTAAAIKKFPYAAVTSETELLNLKIRDDFLTKIFTSANFRAVKAKGTLKALEQFHSKNQYLLMAYSKKKYKLLRHILTNPENSPVTTIFEQYEDQLYKTLIYSPSLNTTEYVFMHSIGHLRTRLSPLEKTHLMGLISNYKLRKIPFKKLRTTFKSTIAKYKEKFLMEQTFFSPYPVQLE